MNKIYAAFYPNLLLPAYQSTQTGKFLPCPNSSFSTFDNLDLLIYLCRIHNAGKEVTDSDFLSPREVEYKFVLPS